MQLTSKKTLLFVGLGALAVYKYTKLSEEEKADLMDKAKGLFDEHISPFLKTSLGLVDNPAAVMLERHIAKN